jgi:pimeloyl-ACP methyl ester carboxylesterase
MMLLARRTVVKWMIATALISTILSACGSPTPSLMLTETPLEPTATVAPTSEPLATFEQAPCPFNVPEGSTVECGFVVVPEDHANPSGATIRLAVAVIRDQGDDHQPDPVILLAGGPGEKTVANTLGLGQVLAPVHPNRDLIVFDQRGVGLSEPALECPGFVEALFEILDEADSSIATQTTFASLMACRDQLLKNGINLDMYNTIQNAADVNAIRLALGYDQINLYGGSYGSLLAQAVMRDFPQGIRSVAMNSVLPLEKSFFIETSITASKALQRLLDSCAADAACNSAYPGLQEELFEVIDRLNADPVQVTLTNPTDGQQYEAVITGDTVLQNLFTFLYISQIIPVLPQAIHNVYEGDVALMTQLSSTRLALLDLTSRGMMLSVFCSEDLIGRTPEDQLNVRASLPRQLVGSADPEDVIEYGPFGMCANWPVEEAGDWVKAPVVSDIPVLVLEGEFDPVTPPEYGLLVAGYLSNSYYFEFPGVGHDVLANECAREIAGDFLADPNHAPNASCMAEMPGVVFDVPREDEELVLESYTDEARGFQGVIPAGWQEIQPANLVRGKTALDPAYFVLEGKPGTAADLLADVLSQLGMDPELDPISSEEVGSFTWDFYAFELGGNPVDLALAEGGGKAYFVALISPPEEHETLYQGLFLPAVEAMAPLG